MKAEVIKSVVAPVFGREGTVLIALSSPEDKEENGFTLALQKNQHLFKMLYITYVCPDCYTGGIRTVCVHRWLDLPEWCTPESLAISKAIIDDEEDFARENLGLVVDNGKNVFRKENIQEIFNRSAIQLNRNVPLVFVTIDPAAGTIVTEKPTSEFAIVSMVANSTCVGMDSFEVKTHHDWDERLVQHFEKLREHERMKGAHFVVAVEANNDHSPSIIYELLMKRFPNVIIPYSSNIKSGKLGTFTTSKSKVNMIELTQSVVAAKQMWFTDDMITTDKDGVDVVKKKMEKQFLRFSREVHISKDGLGRSTVMYTGQLRKGEMDDLVMTTMRNVLLQLEFFQNNSYENYWYYRD